MRQMFALTCFALAFGSLQAGPTPREGRSQRQHTPRGFTALFNGKGPDRLQGLLMIPDPADTGKKPRSIPAWLRKVSGNELVLKQKQKEANEKALSH